MINVAIGMLLGWFLFKVIKTIFKETLHLDLE